MTKRLKIICDDRIPFIKGVLEPYAEVRYLPGAAIGPADVRDADALIIRTRTVCNETLLKDSTVRMIATATIGFDHIDTVWCESHGISWTNAPGCNSASVAQYIGAALSFLARKYKLDLRKLTLGIAGVGHVGSKVAGVAASLGMKTLLCDPPRALREGTGAFCDYDTLLRGSDIVTFHTPLTRQAPFPTFHMLDAASIARLKDGTMVLNSSRGAVVDNASLKEALRVGRIRAAVLDVWEGEPALDRELLDMVDIGTPHIAGYSADGKALGTAMSVQAVSRFFDLPLREWFPDTLPEATWDDSLLPFNYDIERDSASLKADPDAFENLRGDYYIRRERRSL